jgi:hypothetical protein
MSEKYFQHRTRTIQKRKIETKSTYRKAKRLSTTTILLLGLQALQLASRQVRELELSNQKALRQRLRKFRGSGGALLTGKLNIEDMERVRVTLSETAGMTEGGSEGFQVIGGSGCTKSATPTFRTLNQVH